MRLTSPLVITCWLILSVAAYTQCPDSPIVNSSIDTFCTGTRYTFGDTILREGGIYNRVFRDISGCDSLVSLDLRETPNVSFDIVIDTIAPLCLGDSLGGIVIRSVDKAVEPIVYALNGGPEQLSNEFNDLPSGGYQLYIRDRFGCEGRKNIQLRLRQIMGRTFIDTLCAGSTYFLGSQQLTEAGMYTDTLIGERGCDSLITLDLRVEALDNTVSGDILAIQPGCAGDQTGGISIMNVTGSNPPFSLYIDNVLQENFNVNGLMPGDYDVTIYDRNFCPLTEVTSLREADRVFEFSIGEDRAIELGESTRIEIESNIEIQSFSWETAPDPNCTDCTTVEVTPLSSIDYIITATNIEGCTVSDTLSLTVLNESTFYIPSAFSPRGVDADNRSFTVFGQALAIESVTNLSIWDKWGNPVFTSSSDILNDLESGWDGTFDGQQVEAGVYAYQVLIRYINGEEDWLTGTVHLF